MPPSGSIADLRAALRAAVDPIFLRKLQRLRLVSPARAASRPGTTPMRHGSQASGLELTSHKPYAPGDDLRHLDWNVYGRLNQMVVKRFRAEREAPLHVLIDTSASMGVPAADGKLPFAAALALSLAYIALYHRDPVQVAAIGQRGGGARLSPQVRHPQRLHQLHTFLLQLEAHGRTPLNDGVDGYLQSSHLPGLTVVLSDFLVPPLAYQSALERLCARGDSVVAVRVLGPQERDPNSLPRRVRLRDAENGDERLLDLTDAHRARYRQALHNHLLGLKQWCEARAIPCIVADTARSVEPCVLSDLPRTGLLQ